MTFTVDYVADLDSSTGLRESKNGGALFREHVEERTSGEEELVVHVDITFVGTTPEAFTVTDIDLIEPTRGRRFRTSKYRRQRLARHARGSGSAVDRSTTESPSD